MLFLDHCVSNFGVAVIPLTPAILGAQDGATPRKLLGVFIRAMGRTGQALKILLCNFFASTFLMRMFLPFLAISLWLMKYSTALGTHGWPQTNVNNKIKK